ncbi:MAG: hypothetical protein V4489_07460 [Chlamydiota bacterium]
MNSLNKDHWLRIQSSSPFTSWAGYTFGGVCLKYLSKIVHGLGLDVVASGASGWVYFPKNEEVAGAQIDLVITRADNCINLCEMEFCNEEFIVDKGYATNLAYKKALFRKITKTKKTLFTTLVTAYGAKENAQYLASVDNQLSVDVLF